MVLSNGLLKEIEFFLEDESRDIDLAKNLLRQVLEEVKNNG